ASNALAIRIIFPSVRAIRASFNPTGLPASLGKQKKVRHVCRTFSMLYQAAITPLRLGHQMRSLVELCQ
ncbi:hypothetical protein COO31_019490, partial [Vibrio vulnificus]